MELLILEQQTLREAINLATRRKSAWVCPRHGSFWVSAVPPPPPNTFNQPSPSTFAGSHLKYHMKLHWSTNKPFGVNGAIFFYFPPNKFTCEGFLLLWKGCLLGPPDFTCVSHLSPTGLPLDSGRPARTFVYHLSPLLSHYALDALPWFYICHPLASHLFPTGLWMLCPHDFTLISQVHLSALRVCPVIYMCLPLVSRLSPTGLRMLPTWFYTCLQLVSACLLVSQYALDALPVWFYICLPLFSDLSPTRPWMLCPHDFIGLLVS